MFCKLFSDQPVLPAGWDVRHLWVVETLIASTFQADDSKYRGKVDDSETLRRSIESDLAEMMNHADYMEKSSLFPDDVFLSIVKSGLMDFLKNECSHICEAFTRDPVLSVKPDGDLILAVLRSDPQFREFVVETGKRKHQSECGCRKRVS